MTSEEMAEFRELAGLNEPQTTTEMQKEWADKQLTNQPKIENPAPVPTAQDFGNPQIKSQSYGGNSGVQQEVENIADRLNGLMRTPGTPPKQIEKSKETNVDDLATMLNAKLRTTDIKIERLN